MNNLHIRHHFSWGIRHIQIAKNEIKAIEFDKNPSYLKIYYLDKSIDGFIDHEKFNIYTFQILTSKNSNSKIDLYDQDIPEPQIEDNSED